ncbi:MAG: hypothetical protein LUH47_01580 [Clostridiales bacterium]|nr:hypothetical protein [Clostridiales bacterium]
MGFKLTDETNTKDSVEVVYEKSEDENEESLIIDGKEILSVGVKIGEYEVDIKCTGSETDFETKTMKFPVLNQDDEDEDEENGTKIHETYVPAGEFVRALGLEYSEQDKNIHIDKRDE